MTNDLQLTMDLSNEESIEATLTDQERPSQRRTLSRLSSEREEDRSGEETFSTRNKVQVALETILVSPAQMAANAAVNTVGAFLPKMEKLPWLTFFTLSFLIAIPAAIFVLGFTRMGYGLDTLAFIDNNCSEEAWKLFVGIAGFAFFLYLFDCYYWESPLGRAAKVVCTTILLLSASAFVLFISGTYPYGPISLYIIINPIYLVIMKSMCFREKETRTYVSWLSGPLFFVSLVTLITWMVWTLQSGDNEWTPKTHIRDAEAASCPLQMEGNEDCFVGDNVCFSIDADSTTLEVELPDGCNQNCEKRVYSDCSNPFIIWAGPFLVSVGLLFLSFFCTFLRGSATPDQEIMRFAKVWIFMIFTMWVSASLAGAGEGISTTLAAVTLSSFVASSVFLALSYSKKEQEKRFSVLWTRFMEKYGSMLDIAKGLLVVTCAPVAIVYFISSFLNQVIRRYNPCSKAPGSSASTRHIDTGGFITLEARRLVKAISQWNVVPVCTYAVYWGIGFMSLAVLAPIFTTLFLSWLIEATESLELAPVTGILLIVGIVMFLLPPVPGAPIYLTLGIVIIPVGGRQFGTDYIGILISMAYAMVVSLALKLLATALQQKMIGGLLKGSIGVRKLVGINSNLIRAMKLLLIQPGLDVAKVSILCGGPDWPTSVLCGILDLPLLPILLGTLPVMLLIIPTVLAGSFTYMKGMTDEVNNDGSITSVPIYGWAGTAAAISAALAAGVLFGNMVLAAYYVEDTLTNKAEDVQALPIDEEVKVLEDNETVIEHKFAEITRWKVVPGAAKTLMILSVISMIAACYTVQIFGDQAFKSYQLTDTIDDRLGGDWKNIIEPLGLVSICLLALSIVLLQLFMYWASRKSLKELEQEGVSRARSRDAFDVPT